MHLGGGACAPGGVLGGGGHLGVCAPPLPPARMSSAVCAQPHAALSGCSDEEGDSVSTWGRG
jgi:hypothetical protein